MDAVPVGTLDASVPGVRARWRAALGLLVVTTQLALAALLVFQFRLESRTFFHVLLLLTGGFVVHALLPLRARLPFFVMLSVGAFVLAFGSTTALTLIACGLALVGLAHLPVPFPARVGLLLAAGLALALCRASVLPGAWLSNGAWATFGSMFMFRLVLYVRALRARTADDPAPTIASTLAYFLMAPNLSFPLFPVVDYQMFRRQYYDAPALGIYQTGMRWIVRGLIQLLFYRLVYYHAVMDPMDVRDLGDVLQFILATYLLYLRVSGTFHVAIGMLGLFGWRLPETHHLYYLASSFNDYWRRINIYWKDFMMKLVYYPSFFGLRRAGNTTALVGATAAVFIATWLLHSYQWFWLRGGWPITAPDALFWGILGGLVIWNALRETKRGRRRPQVAGSAWSWSRAWRTVGTFTTICLLWSLWSADSVGEWLLVMSAAGTAGTGDVVALGVTLGAAIAVAGWPWGARTLAADARHPWYRHPATITTATLLAAVLLGRPGTRRLLGDDAGRVVASLGKTTLNLRDEAIRNRGYYEQLDGPGRLETALWGDDVVKPERWLSKSDDYLVIDARQLPVRHHRPNLAVVENGRHVTINRWGMRDRDYALAKPANVYRIAIVGASQVFGFGLGDDEPFAKRLEERLNREVPIGRRVEVMNFGVKRWGMLDRLVGTEDAVLAFAPDLVVEVVSWRDRLWIREDLVRLLDKRADLRYPELRAILARHGATGEADTGPAVPVAALRGVLRRAGVDTRAPYFERKIRVRAAAPEVEDWILERMARVTRERGAIPLAVALDMVIDVPAGSSEIIASSQRAGMDVVNLFPIFDGRDPATLRVAPWDDHANAEGNSIVADRLHDELMRRGAMLGPSWPFNATTAAR